MGDVVKLTSAAGRVVFRLAVQRLDVTVQVVGLGLGLGGIVQALGVLLTPLGPVLDAAISPLLDLLGLRLGQADVRVHGVICPDADRSRPVLVG